jgi:hypothetical protein
MVSKPAAYAAGHTCMLTSTAQHLRTCARCTSYCCSFTLSSPWQHGADSPSHPPICFPPTNTCGTVRRPAKTSVTIAAVMQLEHHAVLMRQMIQSAAVGATYHGSVKQKTTDDHVHSTMAICESSCRAAGIAPYLHAYIHTYMHTYMHACMHTCIHAYIHTCIHTYIHTYIRTCWPPPNIVACMHVTLACILS